MRNLNLTLLLLIILLFQVIPLLATVYYVDKDGKFGNGSNNSWPGTMEQPKANLQHDWFQRNLQPGDTVILRQASSYGEMRFYSTSSGTAEAPIVVQAWPGETIISDVAILPTQFAIRILEDASHISIYGPMLIRGHEYSYVALGNNTGLKLHNIEIDGTDHGPRLSGLRDSEFKNISMHDLTKNGFQMRGSASAATGDPCRNLWIENVDAYRVDDDRTPDNSDADGFHSYGGENITLINCSTWDNAEDGFDLNCNAIMVNCKAYDNSASGLKVWRREGDNYAEKTITAINCLFANNGFHPDDTNPGVKVSYGAGLNFYNGVILGGYDQGINMRFTENDGTFKEGLPYQPVRVYNSIIANTTSGTGLRSMNHTTQGNLVEADYNLYFNNAQDISGFTMGAHSITGQDPLFSDPNNGIYSLLANSPAIDMGTDLTGMDTTYNQYGQKDYDGHTRPVAGVTDIGAYEYSTLTGIWNVNGRDSDLGTNLSNYPNPFSQDTRIHFELQNEAQVKLEILDVWGRTVETLIDNSLASGQHVKQWNIPAGESSKLFYLRLQLNNSTSITKKMSITH